MKTLFLCTLICTNITTGLWAMLKTESGEELYMFERSEQLTRIGKILDGEYGQARVTLDERGELTALSAEGLTETISLQTMHRRKRGSFCALSYSFDLLWHTRCFVLHEAPCTSTNTGERVFDIATAYPEQDGRCDIIAPDGTLFLRDAQEVRFEDWYNGHPTTHKIVASLWVARATGESIKIDITHPKPLAESETASRGTCQSIYIDNGTGRTLTTSAPDGDDEMQYAWSIDDKEFQFSISRNDKTTVPQSFTAAWHIAFSSRDQNSPA